MKMKIKFIVREAVLFAIINVFFLLTIIIAFNTIINSYDEYNYLRLRYIILIICLVATVIFCLIKGTEKIRRMYGKIGIISIYSIVNTVMWCFLIFSTFAYSYDFLDFFITEIVLVAVIQFAPIIYILTAIIYFFVTYFKKKNK